VGGGGGPSFRRSVLMASEVIQDMFYFNKELMKINVILLTAFNNIKDLTS
jgi:hypothetical protein